MNLPTIIIPVYNAPEETKSCIQSVMKKTSEPYHLLILDDASTDDRIEVILKSLKERYPRIEIHRHRQNKGFAKNVNYGLIRTKGDVVLLNSDTIVTPYWLDKLRACAYRYPNVATVTPLSNSAGAFSTPQNHYNNKIPEGMTINNMAQKAAMSSYPIPTEAPSGNGFCLYIRRHAIEEIGFLDAKTFPYVGEENDFCQRAIIKNMVNLVDSSCYIYHVKAASFGGSKAKTMLMKQSSKKIHERYPKYKKNVQCFLKSPFLEESRQRLKYAIEKRNVIKKASSKKNILSIIHDGGGGLIKSNKDIMISLKDNFNTYELSCDPKKWSLIGVNNSKEINTWKFGTSWTSTKPLDLLRIMAIRSLIKAMEIDIVHIRTLICLGPEIFPILRNAGVAIIFSIHDFNTICPTNHLLDDKGVFCGGYCTNGKGHCYLIPRWFSDIKNLKHCYVHRWRERMAANLPLADAFCSPSNSVKKLIIEHFPIISSKEYRIIEYGQRWKERLSLAHPPGNPLKVLVLGVLSPIKGMALLSSLYDLNNDLCSGIEFHILGNSNSQKRNIRHVVWHGEYNRENLLSYVKKIKPSFSIICSIVPETYSHTLTESWMLGLPVVASNMGALKERIKRHGGGYLVDSRKPGMWIEALQKLRHRENWEELYHQVKNIRLPSMDDMANEYISLYDFSVGKN